MAERKKDGTWEKGHKGIGGRPKRPMFKTILESLPDCLKLYQHPDAEATLTAEQSIVACIINAAYNGDIQAAKFAAEQIFGKALQSVEQTNIDGNESDPFDGLTPNELRKVIDEIARLNAPKSKKVTRKKKPS